MRTETSWIALALLAAAVVLLPLPLPAASSNSNKPPPPKAAPAVRPVQNQGSKQGQAKTNKQTSGKSGASGTSAGSKTGGSTEATSRAQLIEMLKPGSTKGAHDKSLAAVHPGSSRASFAKPAHIVHNPAHKVGHIGAAHRHAAFMFRHGQHAFYRRYYRHEGAWFWYDEPVPVDDPAYAQGVDGLPMCESDADECSGEIQPLPEAGGEPVAPTEAAPAAQ